MTQRSLAILTLCALFAMGCQTEPAPPNVQAIPADTRPGVEPGAETATAYRRTGLLHLERGNYEEARRAFMKSLALEPDNASAHFRLGIAYAQLGNLGAARYQEEVLRTMDREQRFRDAPIDPELPVMAENLADMIRATERVQR